MRHFRWLLPVAILAIIVAVVSIYVERRRLLDLNAPSLPELLESALTSQANLWCSTKSDADRRKVKVCAEKFRQIRDTDVLELENVSIEIYHETGDEFDLVRSERAVFDPKAKLMTSEGNVEITLGVPAGAPSGGQLLKIYGSAMQVNTDTGIAFTQEDVSFDFDRGSGSAVGAFYDPDVGDLKLLNNVKLNWQGADAEAPPIHIESGEAWYIEGESKVILYPWSKLQRETATGSLNIDAGISDIYLDEGVIRRAEVQMARGQQAFTGTGVGPTARTGRLVEFGGEQLYLDFDDAMTIEKIQAERSAELISTTGVSRTQVNSDRLDLDFVPVLSQAGENDGSVLSNAVATGNSQVKTDPVVRRGVPTPDSRILRSEVIRMAMRTGGEDMESVVTDGPGTLDFVPNQPKQPKRSLVGDRIWIDFATQNRVRQFRSINAFTTTESPDKDVTKTQSEELLAIFDSTSGDLARMEQNGKFRYEEGEQTARSDRAVLEQATGLITLTGSARAVNPSGSVAANTIVLNQSSGDYTADGNVTTTRQPETAKPQPDSTPLLGRNEVLQATAQRMVSTQDNSHIVFEGNAKAWQGSSRVEGDTLTIDRAASTLTAHGNVMTQIVDAAPPASPAASVFTIVHAPDFVYDETTRLAHYTGGTKLERPGLTVDAQQLRAWLSEADEASPESSSLDHAFADGKVTIVSTAPGEAPKTGTSEHAEYYVADQKVILSGGAPRLSVPGRGDTTGQKLTWFANNDRLLVEGAEGAPVRSTIRTK